MSKYKKQSSAKAKRASLYHGSMTFPLLGSQTKEEFHATTKYTGSFAFPWLREVIFSKPRFYKFFVVVKTIDSNFYEEESFLCQHLCDKAELSALLKHYGVEILSGYDLNNVDFASSYFRIEIVEQPHVAHSFT